MDLLADGKITPDEAERLLEALNLRDSPSFGCGDNVRRQD